MLKFKNSNSKSTYQKNMKPRGRIFFQVLGEISFLPSGLGAVMLVASPSAIMHTSDFKLLKGA